MEKTELGRFIKQTRELKKLTLRQLADRSGVSFSMIGKIERGVTAFPSQAVLDAIARALLVPYEHLDRLVRGVEIGEHDEPQEVDPEVADFLRMLKALPKDQQGPYFQLMRDQLALFQRAARAGDDSSASSGT